MTTIPTHSQCHYHSVIKTNWCKHVSQRGNTACCCSKLLAQPMSLPPSCSWVCVASMGASATTTTTYLKNQGSNKSPPSKEPDILVGRVTHRGNQLISIFQHTINHHSKNIIYFLLAFPESTLLTVHRAWWSWSNFPE